MGRIWRRLPVAVVLSMAAACANSADTAPGAQAGGALPEGHPPINGQAAAAPTGAGGVVMETMDGGGYTYVRLGAGEEEIWVAGPVTPLAVGDTIRLANPMSMGKFTSKALDRTFDNLYFADGFVKGAAPIGAPASPSTAGAAHGVQTGVVAETMNAGGYTYVRTKVGDTDVWLAGPETTLKVGDSVMWSGSMVMRGFTSNTLNRTFDEILFVSKLEVTSE